MSDAKDALLHFAEENIKELVAENDKLREQIEHLQPTDCEGNVLDIADTVHMLRSEYDGDHEWDDVVVELVLTKWGGDRWIVRGSRGEAWACDCTKTGYDEDAFEDSDDVEPFDDATLAEVENVKLRELVKRVISRYNDINREYWGNQEPLPCDLCTMERQCSEVPRHDRCLFYEYLRELGVEVG